MGGRGFLFGGLILGGLIKGLLPIFFFGGTRFCDILIGDLKSFGGDNFGGILDLSVNWVFLFGFDLELLVKTVFRVENSGNVG